MNLQATTLGALVVVSVGAGAALGWHFHAAPPAPAVAVAQDFKLHELQLGAFALERTEGPVRVVERWRTAAAPGCPATQAERVTERGPVAENRRTETARQATNEERATASITPPPPSPRPSWAIALGAQLLPGRALTVGVGRRIVGPVWAEGWLAQPLELSPPAVGVGLRVEF